MNKLLCKLFGHKWRYNFLTLPNKCICSRCKRKEQLDLYLLEWSHVESFENETRSNKELINKWNKWIK